MTPTRLGPYRIERGLGRGGMGTVYAAIDDNTATRVAIKVLAPQLAAEPGFRLRFQAEIESLQKLLHPNIVRLFGYGEQDGAAYYAMEYVAGQSLDQRLAVGRFSWREAVELALQICRALRHAHDHGIIHRDLKPANLLLAEDGTVKLTDFGIARLFGQRLTGVGGVIGTAEYMAPEQADGRPVTPQADLYSLGCVLYSLVAGRPPFQADSIPAVLHMQRYDAPPPLANFVDDVPDEFTRLVARLLAKDPQNRPTSARMLIRELNELADDESLDDPPSATASGTSQVADSVQCDSAASPTTVIPTNDAPDARGKNSAAREPNGGLNRYTPVEPRKSSRDGTWSETLGTLLSPQTLILLASLVAVVAGLFYFTRQPSDDALWRDVQAAAADPTAFERLLEVDDEIGRLLKSLPADDERRPALDRLAAQIILIRLERKTRRALPEASARDTLPPIERLLADALGRVERDPSGAARDLQSLVDLYGVGEPTPDAARCVAIAREQLKRLSPLLTQSASDREALLTERLARADALASNDAAAARQIYEAIIRRYADDDWAKSFVERARQALPRVTPPPTTANSR